MSRTRVEILAQNVDIESTLALKDGSTTRLYIDSSGNLAIGNNTSPAGALDVTGNIVVSGTVDGRDVAADGAKLDAIEAGATADQTAAEIKTAYESNNNTNAFTDAEQTKLSGIAAGAEVNVNADWNATTGDAVILNKPSIPTDNAQLTNGAGYITSADGGDAGLLDGLDSTQFLRSDTTDTFTGTALTIDSATDAKLVMRVNASDTSDWNYIEFRGANGTRDGYLGTNQNGTMQFSQDGGSYLQLSGTAGTANISGNTIWTAGNDGPGSGLDADTLDGINSASFLRSDVSDNYTGSQLQFTNTGVSTMHHGSQGWQVSGSDAAYQRVDARDDATNYSRMHWYGVSDTGSTSNFRHAWYDGSAYINVTAESGELNFARTTGTTYLMVDSNTVWHTGNDGPGSGLDADTLDGVQGTNYLRSNTTDSFTGTYLRFTDNKELQFGDGDDLTISSDGTNTNFDTRSGANINFYNAGTGRIFFDMLNGGIATAGTITVNGSTVWHAGNDGSGSGLDADTLDSHQLKTISSPNLASSANWTVGTGYADDTGTGGQFGTNGDGNLREWGLDPYGRRGIIWVTRSNDTASDADGGWNKTINGLDDNKSYMSVVFVKRASSSTNGSYYHGCSGSQTLNLNGTANTNPYFSSFSISTLPQDVWCVSIGFIRANGDSNTSNTGIGGVYRLDNGEKIVNFGEYKMKSGATTQTHRTYLYYSTDPAAELHWWGPGFYEINGQEPSVDSLISGVSHAAYAQTPYVDVDNSTNANRYLTFADSATASYQDISVDSTLKYNPFSGTLTAINFAGTLVGTAQDADTVDSLHATSFLRSDAQDTQTSGGTRYNDNVSLTLGNSDDAAWYFDGVGTTILNNQNNVTDVDFRWNNAWRYRFSNFGSAYATQNWNSYSDISLKSNIEVIPNALDKVAAIRGVTYDRIDIPNSDRQTGVIAQEIEAVLPEVVSTDDQGIKSVSYGNIVGLLIEAIKEQQATIQQLTERIEVLEGGN